MASLLYDDINKSFLRKITDYDFFNMNTDDITSQMMECLHGCLSKPYLRRLFTQLILDDEVMEITYELKLNVEEFQDRDFIIEACALGMLVEWLEPQLNSKLLTQQMFTSSKESKWYDQKGQISAMRALMEDSVIKQRKLISDRGYIYNKHLGYDEL